MLLLLDLFPAEVYLGMHHLLLGLVAVLNPPIHIFQSLLSLLDLSVPFDAILLPGHLKELTLRGDTPLHAIPAIINLLKLSFYAIPSFSFLLAQILLLMLQDLFQVYLVQHLFALLQSLLVAVLVLDAVLVYD